MCICKCNADAESINGNWDLLNSYIISGRLIDFCIIGLDRYIAVTPLTFLVGDGDEDDIHSPITVPAVTVYGVVSFSGNNSQV